MSAPDLSDVDDWLRALEARHLATLTFPEVRRAVQALSARYVGRRLDRGAADVFGGAGKRAAFALFFTPLHALVTRCVVDALGAGRPAPRRLLDLGCGAGAAAAGWALACTEPVEVLGLDRSRWALAEARWNWAALGLRHRTVAGDAAGARLPGRGDAVVAGWTLNELDAAVREELVSRLVEAAGRGARVLVLEPVARGVAPWWPAAGERIAAAGGRADEWRFRAELPDVVARLGRAAGLDHREQTARSLYLPGSGAGR